MSFSISTISSKAITQFLTGVLTFAAAFIVSHYAIHETTVESAAVSQVIAAAAGLGAAIIKRETRLPQAQVMVIPPQKAPYKP